MSWEEKKKAIEERAKRRRIEKLDEQDKLKQYFYKEPEKRRPRHHDYQNIKLWDDCDTRPWVYPVEHERVITKKITEDRNRDLLARENIPNGAEKLADMKLIMNKIIMTEERIANTLDHNDPYRDRLLKRIEETKAELDNMEVPLEQATPYALDDIESWLGKPYLDSDPEEWTAKQRPVEMTQGTWADGTGEQERWDFPEE